MTATPELGTTATPEQRTTATPELGKEYPQPGEERDIQDINDTILRHLKKTYPPGKSLRQFHPKMHGFLEAVFRVDADLPLNVRHGFLQPGATYKAWIRFSNGNTRILDDRKADLRGMAIKLLDVPGEMLAPDEKMPQSQDIVLVSYPTLMSPDVAGFKKNIRAICGGLPAMLWFGINPLNWPTLVRTLQSMGKTDHLFSQRYWSVSPSRLGGAERLGGTERLGITDRLGADDPLGGAEQAVKYSVVPATQIVMTHPDKTNPCFLREVMQAELNTHDFHFHFLIQFQEDAVTMPIENPCVEWKSEWHKVAELIIPKQFFDTTERNEAGERASYSPWHSLAEHRPLGGISRARRAVYATISAFREQNNKNL
jgi:hypothetical protein